MRKTWIGRGFFLLFIYCALHGAEIPDFNNLSKIKDVTFLLSTPKSGTNLITGCLSIITRRPISWLNWGNNVFDPLSERRNHPSYNRLGLPLVSDIPLLYRSHYEFVELLQLKPAVNRLILLTRNPKELLFRKFFLEAAASEIPEPAFIHEFLDKYLEAFYVYEAWIPRNRVLVFYEDFITGQDETLLQLLSFMKEDPIFLEDFMAHKEAYLSKLLESYTKQHVHNSGGASSREGPKPIHYSKNASMETLMYIDEYLKRMAPQIWESYLKRFESPLNP